jgi:hypothetical protein
VSAEQFVISRRWRGLFSGMLLAPCLLPLAREAWRPTPEDLRNLPGPWGFSIGTWPFLLAIEGIVLGGLMWLLQAKAMTLAVTDGGVTLYRLWRLRWEDVTAAQVRTILGLRYLHVVRSGRTRPSLWLPLYFDGPRSVSIALRDCAPRGNPIRECLDAAIAERIA